MGVFRSKFIRALPGCGRNARRAFAVAGVSGFLCLLALLLNACGPGVDLERPGRGLAKGGAPEALPASMPLGIEFTVPPESNATAGVGFDAVGVSVVDTRGAVITDPGEILLALYSDAGCQVPLSKSPGGAPAISGGNPQEASGSLLWFYPTVTVAGTVYLGASSTSQTLLGACSDPIMVSPGDPDQSGSTLMFDARQVSAGTPVSVELRVLDAWGNPVTGVNPNQFGFSSSDYDGEGFFNGNASESEAGTYKISFTGTTAGHVTLSADFQGNSVADSIVVQVIAGTATRLVFTTQTGGGVAGQVWRTQPEVEVQDDYGNTVSDYADSVELSLGSTKLFGKSSVIPTNGVATFSGLSVRIAGTGLNLTATSGTLNSASSAPFSVSPGAAAQLAFTTQPGGGVENIPWNSQPVVEVQDSFGNRADSSVQIMLRIATGPNSGTSLGTVTASGGVASFTGLAIPLSGTYTLNASATNLSSTKSSSFSIEAPLLIAPAISVVNPFQTGSVQFSTPLYSGTPAYSKQSGPGSINSAKATYSVDASHVHSKTVIRATSASGLQVSDASLYQVVARFNGAVKAIAVDGGYGYFGGEFTGYNAHLIRSAVSLDSASGDPLAGCNLAGLIESGMTVYAVAETDSHVLVGGNFYTYNGALVSGLIKVNKTTCALDEQFSLQAQTFGSGSSPVVRALAISGSSLYVGGSFSSYRGATVQNLVKIDLETGALDSSFTQTTGFNGTVNALAVKGNGMFVGGSFSSYRGLGIQNMAKVDLSTGNLDDTFTRTSGFNGEVFALKVVGDSIYAGGAFTTYKGEAAQRLAKLDTTSCNLNTAFTQSTGANGTVFALEADGSSLYLGGAFGTYRGQSAARIAKVDLSTGAPIDSFPAAQGFAGYGVYSLFLQNSSLYVGGLFDSYRGTPVQGLAKVNPSDGGLDSGFSKPEGFDGRVQVVTGPATGGSLWVGGSMRSYRGQPAHGLAKVRLSDAVLDTDFTQTTGFDGSVNAVLVSGASIFVGGAFSKYRGTAASGLVKLNASNGSMDSGFQARATGDVNALAVSPTDGALFIGGAFSSMGGASARNLAKVNPDDGNSLSDFSQSSGTDGRVLALLASGSSLYVGGEFTTYRSQDAKFLAKVDASNGNLDTTFTQTLCFDGPVRALAGIGSSVYAGGGFSTYRGQTAKNLAKVDASNGNLDTTFTQSTGPNGSVYALMVGDSSLFVGGDFYTYRGQYGNLGVLNLDRSTGNPVSGFTGRANGVVYALSTSGADLLLGGRFTYGNSGLETEVQNGVPVSMSTGVASGF